MIKRSLLAQTKEECLDASFRKFNLIKRAGYWIKLCHAVTIIKLIYMRLDYQKQEIKKMSSALFMTLIFKIKHDR